MLIEKTATNNGNFRLNEYYYESAREGMFDLLNNMRNAGMLNSVILPGYIGWSPKEGSGVFDPISKISCLDIIYYKMTEHLGINVEDLRKKIEKQKGLKFAVLVVNYFGFVDPQIKEITELVKANCGWLIEDNAHGFLTFQSKHVAISDAMFFSIHKLFPYKHGGSLLIINEQLKELKYLGCELAKTSYNPWMYDINEISNKRRENYLHLVEIINESQCTELFSLLRPDLEENVVPQSFPIQIITGNRNKIYEQMNSAGYGVVSLYHTLIEPLRNSDFQESIDLSKSILNLPVHQDVDPSEYAGMIKLLINLCTLTSK